MLNAVRFDIQSSFTAFMHAHLQGKTLVLRHGYGMDTIRVYIHRHESQGEWTEPEIEELKLNFQFLWNYLGGIARDVKAGRRDFTTSIVSFEGAIDNSVVTFNVRARPDLKTVHSNSLVCEMVSITPGRSGQFPMPTSGVDLYPSAMSAELVEAQEFMRGGVMGEHCLTIRRVDHRNYSAMVVFLISEDTIRDYKLITEWLTASHQLYIEFGHRMDGYVFEIPNDDPEEPSAKFKVEQLSTDCLKRGMADSVKFFGVKPVKD